MAVCAALAHSATNSNDGVSPALKLTLAPVIRSNDAKAPKVECIWLTLAELTVLAKFLAKGSLDKGHETNTGWRGPDGSCCSSRSPTCGSRAMSK